MLFYYVQIKDRHDSGVIMREKVSVETKGGGGGGGGALRLLAGILGGRVS